MATGAFALADTTLITAVPALSLIAGPAYNPATVKSKVPVQIVRFPLMSDWEGIPSSANQNRASPTTPYLRPGASKRARGIRRRRQAGFLVRVETPVPKISL